MNHAQERLDKTLVARVRRALKDVKAGAGPAPASGSSDSSSVPATIALSPTAISSKAKRPRADGCANLIGETGKGTYDLPPCWLEKSFFDGATLHLPWSKSLLLEGMSYLEKRALLA